MIYTNVRITWLAARGSGESPQDWTNPAAYIKDKYRGAGEVNWDVYTRLATAVPGLHVSLDPIMYRADPVFPDIILHVKAYLASVASGTETLLADMQLTDHKCGGTVRYVLTGYSQGAWAIHDALHQMTSAQLGEVAGVALFGDPDFLPGQAIVRDHKKADSHQGVAVPVDPKGTGVPPKVTTRTGSWCYPDDPICQLTASNIARCAPGATGCPHFKYKTGGETAKAAGFLAPLLPQHTLFPRLTLTSPPAGTISQPYRWPATASCPSSCTWTTTAAELPPGLTLAPSGVLGGMPSRVGTYTFPVTATVRYGRAASADVTIVITGASPGSWTVRPTISPGAWAQLQGVSCASPANCIAVGYYYASSSSSYPDPLAERWDGNTWAAMPVPYLPSLSALTGISCTSDTSCTAVGYDNTSGQRRTLAAHWNGSAWSVQATPNPPGGLNYLLAGVSCATATSCAAVGYYYDAADVAVPLAEHWNGSAWAIQATPDPSNDLAAFDSVSCASATSCTAVGYYDYYTDSGGIKSLAEHWNGSKWSAQATPTPPGASDHPLQAVSCNTATSCIAVGGYVNGNWQPLAEKWDGSSWSIQKFPAESSGILLFGISCVAATRCTAVGAEGFGTQAQAEYWDGSSWSAQTVANPSSGGSFPYNRIGGVSFPSAVICAAVGYYADTAGNDVTLAESNY